MKRVNTFSNYVSFTESRIMVCHLSLGFIYNMFGCAVLDLPFGWERGTDEDGTLIFIE